MSSQTPQITQLIVNDIANSQLSSYQIAYKYHISKTSVDHIGRSHLGDSLYDQKEQLACQKLNEDIQTLKDQGLSSNLLYLIFLTRQKPEQQPPAIIVRLPDFLL